MPATRLISRLREHDWLAAAIELVIVVAGIRPETQALIANIETAQAH
ncbi:MAG: hypothetical protein JSS13_10275 [Proteobacteria bacterium]|nr:hypothetical protein [Pseudomonadota bacterium]